MSQSGAFKVEFGSPKVHDEMVDNPKSNPLHLEQIIGLHKQKHHLDKLVNHQFSDVRDAVAKQGHPEHLDKLVHDDNQSVQQTVAEMGTDRHHDILMHSPNDAVRQNVAFFGSKKHAAVLQNDPSESVRYYAQKRLSKLDESSQTLNSFIVFTNKEQD